MADDLVKRLRSLADCDSRAGEPLGRAMREAADRIEQLERERDYTEGTNEVLRGENQRLEATVATLTAQVEAMRGALEKIATLAPVEKPPEPYDDYGWQVADTGERHAQMVRDHDMWLAADCARAALTTEKNDD